MATATVSQWSSGQQKAHHVRSASTSSAVKMNSTSLSSSRHTSSKHADMYDRFYGHREISELSECVITALFACPLDSTSSSVNGSTASTNGGNRPTPRLAEFIAYALHRTRLPDEITFQALFLLRRLKSRFPAARGSSGHRLFISALMLASKSSCDDTYSNKSWTIVSQGLFSLREVNQMERELFGYLGYKVNVEFEELDAFTSLLLAGDVATVVDMGNGASSNTAPSSPIVAEEYHHASTTATDITPTKMQYPQNAQSYGMSRQQSNQHRSRASMSAVYADTVSPKTNITAMASASTPSVYATSDAYMTNVHGGLRAPYVQQQQQQQAQAGMHHLSPSMASMSSSRGSISSTSQYSMTPSPTALSQSESSNSSRASPDTPPAEFEASPWTDDGKSQFSGEPAGTYDDEYQYYHHSIEQAKHSQQQQYYGGQQNVYMGDVHHAYQQ